MTIATTLLSNTYFYILIRYPYQYPYNKSLMIFISEGMKYKYIQTKYKSQK